jgi:peptide/nickel transport system substrate-binding protein
MRLGRFMILICFGFFLILVASSPSMAGKDHLIVAFEDSVKTMDYYQTTQRIGVNTGYMMYDPLLKRDPKDGSLHPHLVTEWKIINDTTWEFKLRPGVKFHNGNPLTAESIRFTIEDRVLDPAQKSPTAAGWKWIKKVEVKDDLTFRFITDGPYPALLERLNVLFPYDPRWVKEMVAKNGEAFLSRNTMGTGPFKFVKFIEGNRIELERNENYWDKGYPKFPKMTIRFIPEQSTRIAELISGGIDAAGGILSDQIATVNNSKAAHMIIVPAIRISFWQFDSSGRAPNTPPALKDVRVRRAIWHAIDREAIIKNVLGGNADLVNIPQSPRQFAADTSIKGYEYNPEKAKALLKEAGHEKGLTLSLWTYTAITKMANEAAIGYLERVGIKGVIRDYVGRVGEMEKLCQTSKTEGILNMTWGSYNIFDPDAIMPYFFMSPEAPYDYTNDAELAGWLREARRTLDKQKRRELYAKAQKRIIDQAYWMPFFTTRTMYGVNKNLSLTVGVDEVPRFQYATWK